LPESELNSSLSFSSRLRISFSFSSFMAATAFYN
jgi:hypothetical protein